MEKIGKKLKHDHTLTSILKFAIFSMVMLAPIFSVASRCLYVICNKNAYQSYSDNEQAQLINITQWTQFEKNTDYYVTQNETFTNGSVVYVYNSSEDNFISNTGIKGNAYRFANWGNGLLMYFYEYNYDNETLTQVGTSNPGITFNTYKINIAKVIANGNYGTNLGMYFNTYLMVQGTLDNAFEYSLSQLEESEYYNWATNLGIYTPINNMVSGLGGHSVISLLLAYWSIYTAIYIVFDIIITCFVKITHLIQGE